ncbi:uncharacterized protein LOC131941029 [Physella acuta]|uniref:uncharacterized protein LOC131941029 n=1 Tax=Physella acuta TaxID=109671 RepID=UPI0027DBEF92|nr:uncharacterized protein LOC131941029 [Physella acuta]
METLHFFLFFIAFTLCTADHYDLPEGSEAVMTSKYPGYFKTAREIKALKAEYKKAQSMKGQEQVGSQVCYHGCCTSEYDYVIFDTLKDIRNNIVTLVKFSERAQYFYTETCTQSPRCLFNCQCHMVYILEEAVVYSKVYGDLATLTYVWVPAFCRCYNHGGVRQQEETFASPDTISRNEL